MSIIKNITLISMFTMVACTEGKDTGEPQSSPSEHWNSGAVGICEVEREDPFTVTDASLDGDTIVVDVSYSGGCGSHDWQFCWDGNIAESMPYQVFVSIGHNANGDSCEMEKTDTINVDLGELEEAPAEDAVTEAEEPAAEAAPEAEQAPAEA